MNQEGCGRKQLWPILKYYSSICHNILSFTWLPRPQFLPQEYEAEVLTTTMKCCTLNHELKSGCQIGVSKYTMQMWQQM